MQITLIRRFVMLLSHVSCKVVLFVLFNDYDGDVDIDNSDDGVHLPLRCVNSANVDYTEPV